MRKLYTTLLTLGLLALAHTVMAQIATYPYNQNFEGMFGCNSSCGPAFPCFLPPGSQWANDTNDDDDWRVYFGGTPTPNTGPSIDHNPGTPAGNFLYLEGSGCPLKTSHLLSPYFNFTGYTVPVVTFWYHMYGADMGTMHLDVDTNGTWINDVVPAWTDNINLWQERVFMATAFGNRNNVRFRIRGITGPAPGATDMAIDDFSIYMLEPNDAGVSSILEPNVSCPGVVDVKVRIKNYGTNVIDSVTVEWSINSVPQTPFLYTPPIGLTDSADVVIGTMNLVPGTIYNLFAKTVNPNGVPDPQVANDFAFKNGIQSAFVGTYTIGGASPNYNTFAAAANALSTYGVCGPVVFNVRNGTYNDQISLQSIAGTSSTNTITFQSESGDSSLVKLTYPTAVGVNYIVRLIGQSYVTFKQVTLEATGPTYASVVDISGGSHYNKFLNCHLIGTGGTTSTLKSLVNSPTTSTDNYNEFRNNRMDNGSNGFSYYGTPSVNDTGTVIENNVINCYAAGITIGYQHDPVVMHNKITSNVFTPYTSASGINISNTTGSLVIGYNHINTKTGTYGIQLQSCVASVGNEGLVYNNMVHVGGGTGAYALYITGSTSYINFFYNTFQVSSTNTGSGRSLYLSSTGSGLRFLNNLITNTGGGYGFYAQQTVAVAQSDYNDIYSTGTYIGFWSGNIGSLSGWQSASGQDANSVSVNPGYLTNDNLHVTSSGVDGKATPLAAVTIDIDGEPRDATTPDIGADEFTPPEKELAVVGFIQPPAQGCFGSQTQVTIKVYNHGTQPQSNFTVSYRVYAITVATETVTSTIPPNDSLIYTFNTTVNISAAGNYPFSAWVSLAGDGNPFNDTIIGYLVTNTGTYDQFPYFQDFEASGNSIPPGWANVSTDGSEDWRFNNTGSPLPSGIPGDHTTGTSSGHFAWVDDNAPHSASVELHSPCFDLAALTTPMLEFYYWNPYPSPSILLHVDVLDNGTWVNDVVGPLGYSGSSTWTHIMEPLTAFAGKAVKIRFRAEETGTVLNQDIAIDDVRIFEPGAYNTAVISIDAPETKCGLGQESVTIKIASLGTLTLNPGAQVPVRYSINGGTPVAETITLTAPVQQYDTITYTFNTKADMAAAGTYNLSAWTNLPNDDDVTNDTSKVVIQNRVVDVFTYTQDFESFTVAANATGYGDSWTPIPANTTTAYRWNVHSGSTPSGPNTGPSVDHTTGTTAGKYVFTEANNGLVGDSAILVRSCFDLSQLTSPGVNFSYHMYGGNIGSLHLDIISESGTITRDVWSASGNPGNLWLNAAVPLSSFSGQVSLRFRAHRGNGALGDIALDDVRVGNLPVVNLPNPATGCGFVWLDAGNPGSTYVWSNGATSQSAPIVVGPNPPDTSVVSVLVVKSDGMYIEATTTVILQDGPFVYLGADTIVCGATSLQLNAGNPGSSYVWDNASTSQTRTITADGVYHVSVTKSGCTKSDTISVNFEVMPVASFNVNPVSGTEFGFQNTSQGAIDVQWDFGDGFTSTLSNPTHIYTSPGSYTVKLVITNLCGSDSVTQQVTVVGIEEPMLSMFNLFPNPADDIVTVEFHLAAARTVTFILSDVTGRVVFSEDLGRREGRVAHSLQTGDLSEGVYLVSLKLNDELRAARLVITR